MRSFSQIISACEWENQHITHHNVLEAHAPLKAYTSREGALARTSFEYQIFKWGLEVSAV